MYDNDWDWKTRWALLKGEIAINGYKDVEVFGGSS